MTSTCRPISYHPRSLKRNQELRDLLVFIEANPEQASIAGITAAFKWKLHTVEASLVIMRRNNLIRAANGLLGKSALYAVCPHRPEDLDALIPNKAPEGYVQAAPTTTHKAKTQQRSAAPIYRDPMTALLMGGSRSAAPSLNFTDSMNGV